MRRWNLSHYGISSCVTAALLAGCGGMQPPVGAPVMIQQAPSSASVEEPALVRRLAQGTGEVQYFSNAYDRGTLLEFDYPKGESPIGSISFNGGGFCTKGVRTFWTMGSDEIAEFKVGGQTPIRVLKANASACAIDPATGDLAALPAPFAGGVVIFHKARGKGKVISGTQLAYGYFDAYDNQSNLFVDGFNSSASFALVELKKGSNTFETITTSNTVEFPGSVQWDGKYLTVTDQLANAIYRYTVSGTTATLKGTVSLSGASDCGQTWIERPYIYCADAGNDDGEVFKYPAGGSVLATFSGMDLPLGVVSLRVR